MNTDRLSEFVRRLAEPLAVVGGPQTAADLRSVADALAPFGHLELGRLAEFLRHADEYRRTGKVAVPDDTPEVAELRAATADLARLTGQADGDAGASQAKLAEAAVKLLGRFGVKAGKMTPDANWLTGVREKAAVDRLTRELATLAGKVKSADELAGEAVQQEVARLAAAEPNQLKAAAIASGVAKTSKSKGQELVHEAVAKKAGFALGGKKGGGAKKKEADEAAVAKTVEELKALAVRSLDPNALSYEDVDAEMKRIEAVGFSDAQLKRIAFEVVGVKEKSGKNAKLAIRGKLTAARRAMDSQKA